MGKEKKVILDGICLFRNDFSIKKRQELWLLNRQSANEREKEIFDWRQTTCFADGKIFPKNADRKKIVKAFGSGKNAETVIYLEVILQKKNKLIFMDFTSRKQNKTKKKILVFNVYFCSSLYVFRK